MSAIWGAVDFSGKAIEEDVKQKFRECFAECVIDRTEELSEDNAYFACGIQYINDEAKYEKLPVKSDGHIFTADAILDNREEVCNRLGIPNADVKVCLKSQQTDGTAAQNAGVISDRVISDGEIIRLAFEKLGRESLDLMRGAYCFVRYDRMANRLEIVSDAVGNRFVYYAVRDNVFYFSSLMRPLELILKASVDMKWIAGFLGQDGLDIFMDSESTSLEGVKRIIPAGYMVVDNGNITVNENYWNANRIKRQKKNRSDAEYRDEFRAIYTACIKDAIRTNGEVAILLSSGYDSTSVACIAAPLLKEQNKNLYSFTSVPEKGYENDKSKPWVIGDESALVKKTVEYLGNVDPTFIDLSDVNLWDVRKEFIRVCEFPYKSVQNMIWLYEGYKKAAGKGAKIMLTGAFGNGTVSFDNSTQYLLWLIKHFKFKRYVEEVNAFNKRLGTSRKKVLKFTFKGLFVSLFPKTRLEDSYKRAYVRKEFIERYGVIKFMKDEYLASKRSFNNPDKCHDTFLPLSNFRHYGEFGQKDSLYTGVIQRDPTRDKRMVEFVKSIPHDQFSHNGYLRRLVREYLEDIMPPGYFVRHPSGMQSADTNMRFQRYDGHVVAEWKSIASSEFMDSDLGREMLDRDKLMADIEGISFKDMKGIDIMRIFYTLCCIEYISQHGQ